MGTDESLLDEVASAARADSRSRKAVLIAAAATGVVLLASPLLLSGGGSRSPGDRPIAAVPVGEGSGTPIPSMTMQALAPGEVAPAAPSPDNSPSGSATAAGATPLAPSTTLSPHRTATSPATGPSAVTAVAGAPGMQQTRASVAPTIRTAATAVTYLIQSLQLAGASPGRHICYRAFVAGSGWQRPVCDGEMAGTMGQGLAIEALDIATANVGGVNGNPYVEGIGWPAHWNNVADNTDLYLGTANRQIDGVAVSVNSGNICVNAEVQNLGWQGQRCSNASFTSAGTEQPLRIEAIRLSV